MVIAFNNWKLSLWIFIDTEIEFVHLAQADDEEDEEQQEKVPTEAANENDNDASMPESKPAVVTVNDDDEPMPEVKNDENLNNGSPDEEETRSQKNEADNDGKELADGEIADLSGDESKAADAPETIDLGLYFHWDKYGIDNPVFRKILTRTVFFCFLILRSCRFKEWDWWEAGRTGTAQDQLNIFA